MNAIIKAALLLLIVLAHSCHQNDPSDPEETISSEADLLKLELENDGVTYSTLIIGTNVTLSGLLEFGTDEVTIKTLQISEKATADRSAGDVLQVSDSPIVIEITAEDGSSKSYNLTLQVAAASANANLLALELKSDDQTFTTSIEGTDVSLQKVLPYHSTEVTVSKIQVSANATCTLAAGAVLSLSQSPITLEITAGDGITTKTYSLTLETQACYQMPFGVSLAGAEFGSTFPGTYNSDYTYPTAAELDYFLSKGLKLIRLPFKWERLQPTPGGNLDAQELARIENLLDMAKDRDMVVLLDLHNYGRYHLNGADQIIGSSSVQVSHIRDFWSRLSAELAGRDEIWGYGIMNEPHDLLASIPWKTIAQSIIDGIREHDTNTTIVVGGDSWSSAERWLSVSDNLKNLQDPSDNLVFEAHVYFDDDASGSYNSSYDGEGAYENIGVDRVEPFIDWLQTNRLRGFVGEYGIPADDSRWLTVLDNLLQYLNSNCVNGTYWAAGPWWGSYILSVEPENGVDKPQMSILEQYISTE